MKLTGRPTSSNIEIDGQVRPPWEGFGNGVSGNGNSNGGFQFAGVPAGGSSAPADFIPPVARALLNTIAGTESAGAYNVIYGGRHISDLSQHPNIPVRIQSGPNAGKFSAAAGAYQFQPSTWASEAKKLGLTDFGRKSQDLAGWDYAKTTYSNVTGRNLQADLEAGKNMPGIARALSTVWTSLPGGIEQGQNHSQFAQAFNSNLGRVGASAPDAPVPASPSSSIALGRSGWDSAFDPRSFSTPTSAKELASIVASNMQAPMLAAQKLAPDASAYAPASGNTAVPPAPVAAINSATNVANIDSAAGNAASALGTAPTLASSSAPPIPMNRLRVTPADSFASGKKLFDGSAIDASKLSPADQQKLFAAMPDLLAMQGDQGKQLAYLQANGLLNTVLSVVPRDNFFGMQTTPKPFDQWGLGTLPQFQQKMAAATNPDNLAPGRKIGQNGLPASNATLDPLSSAATPSSSWAAPYLSRSIAGPSPLPGSSGSASYGNVPAAPPPLPGASGSSRYGNIVAPPLPIPRPAGGAFGPMEMAANTTGSAFGGVSPGASASSSASIASPSALAWARVNSPGDLRGDVAPAPYNPSPIVPQSVYPLPPPSNYNAGYMNLGGKHPSPPPAPISPYGAPPSISPYGAPQSISPYGAPPSISPYGAPQSISPLGLSDPIYGTDITASGVQGLSPDDRQLLNDARIAANRAANPNPLPLTVHGATPHGGMPLPVPAAPPPPPPPDFRGSSTNRPYWVDNTYAGTNGYDYRSIQRPDGSYGFQNMGETPAQSGMPGASGSAFYGGAAQGAPGIAPPQSAGDMFKSFLGNAAAMTPVGRGWNALASVIQAPQLGNGSASGGMLHGLLGNILGQAPPRPTIPFAPLNAAQLSGANPNYVAAYNSGQSSYQPTGAGGFVPTQTVGGGGRQSYGDVTNGLGQSLTSTF